MGVVLLPFVAQVTDDKTIRLDSRSMNIEVTCPVCLGVLRNTVLVMEVWAAAAARLHVRQKLSVTSALVSLLPCSACTASVTAACKSAFGSGKRSAQAAVFVCRRGGR